MAKLFQTTPIVLPDFSDIQQKAQERQFNRQMQLDNYLSQFQEQQGYYLPGHREAVQGYWGDVQKEMDNVSKNPRDVNSRRALREAQSRYNELAGAAQYLAQQYRAENEFATANPDKIAMNAEDWALKSDAFATTRGTSDDILRMASMGTPYRLDRVVSYDVTNPQDHATKLLAKSENLLGDWVSPTTGKVDENKLREYVRENLNSVLGAPEDVSGADAEELERALVWARNSRGFNGVPGQLSAKDLQAIRSLPAEQQAEAINFYRQKVEDNFMRDAQRYIQDRRTIYRQNLSDRGSQTGGFDPSKQIFVESVQESYEIPEGTFSSVGSAYLAENQRGSYVDPASKKKYQISQLVKGADGAIYGVALSQGDGEFYSLDAGSEVKMVPIDKKTLFSAFSTSERPYIADAYQRLLQIAGPSVRQKAPMGPEPAPQPSFSGFLTGMAQQAEPAPAQSTVQMPSQLSGLPMDVNDPNYQPLQREASRLAFNAEELAALEAEQRARATGGR